MHGHLHECPDAGLALQIPVVTWASLTHSPSKHCATFSRFEQRTSRVLDRPARHDECSQDHLVVLLERDQLLRELLR